MACSFLERKAEGVERGTGELEIWVGRFGNKGERRKCQWGVKI